MENPIIALLTDFGDSDFFVASMKGVIAGINPSARTVDITHHIPSFDTLTGKFVLFAACRYFPPRTIFLVVVDPGVGTSRKILLVETDRYYFIAPDNGVLSLALDEEEIIRIIEVTNAEYFLPECSHTFEGRDKMAPAASWLSKGVPSEKFGPKIESIHREKITKPEIKGDLIMGSILYADKFGNLITNITPSSLKRIISQHSDASWSVCVERRIESFHPKPGIHDAVFRNTYGGARQGDLLILPGSLGLLEVAVREGSAADKLHALTGDRIILTLKTSDN